VVCVGLAMTAVSSVLSFVWLVESPLWQLKMGRVQSAKQTLFRMMQMNGVACADEIERVCESC